MFTSNAPGGLPYPKQPLGLNTETQFTPPFPVGAHWFDLPPPPLPPPRSLYTWTQGVPINLLGQDTMFGGPGQPLANTDWPLPVRQRPPAVGDALPIPLVAFKGIQGKPFNQTDWPLPVRAFQFTRTEARNPQLPVLITLIAVPSVVGLTQTAANASLIGAGFTVTVLTTYSSTVALNLVISQTPAAGSLQPNGAAITIVVSLGPIPPIGTHPTTWSADGNFIWSADGFMSWTADGYEAFPEGAFAITLANAGYNVGTITYVYSQTDPLGTVMSTTPQPYTLAPPGSYINLVVSNGPIPAGTIVTVPNVVGLYYYDAQLALLSVGLYIAQPVFVLSSTVLPTYVISQSIAPGTQINAYTQVTITVSGFTVTNQGGSPLPVP
jgi:hypothetical protein